MPNANIKSYLNLHLIVFIWGFTAVLGDLISIGDTALVWYRMWLAAGFLFLFLVFRRRRFLLPAKATLQLVLVGLLIAMHWIFFFKAINISNVSITLAMFSMGSFFAAVLEPLVYRRKMLWYELLFGVVIMAGLGIIMQVEIRYLNGILAALFSVFLGVLFTLCNGKLIQKYDSTVISLYEFAAGATFVSIYLLATGGFSTSFFKLSTDDWMLILILASVCTAYAFTASVFVMKNLSPYTVMLTTNLEPVYGIILAYFILGEDEKMSLSFYIGAVIILLTVILNGIIKHRSQKNAGIPENA
jgi:drug/metabolite transporter (DMT)-like permease